MIRIRSTLVLGFLAIACTIDTSVTITPGHMQPFGSHTTPDEVDTFSEFPEPKLFWHIFISGSKPVLMKYVLRTGKYPPFQLWTDEYLKEKYGEIEVNIHSNSENHQNPTVTLKEFLEMYKDVEVSMEQIIHGSMQPEMYIPRSIQCGGPQHYIDTITFEMDNFQKNTDLYLEQVDSFRCALDGNEDIFLIDRKHRKLVEAEGWSDGYSSVDVTKVDMEEFPKLKEVPIYKLELKAGDCAFIPQKWYRQINSFSGRNLAINIMFIHLHWFNKTDCIGIDTSKQILPFKDYNFISDFRNDNIRFLYPLLNEVVVSRNGFLHLYTKQGVDKHMKKEIISFVDTNSDNKLSWEELLSMDVRSFINTYSEHLNIDTSALDRIEGPMFNHDEL